MRGLAMPSPFDFINAINVTKKDLLREDPLNEKDYSPFMVNRGLSYFSDTVMMANEMNLHNGIPKVWQNDFLLNTVSKKKRFSKWHKKEAEDKVVLLIMEYYKYSTERAREVLDILTPAQIKIIEEKLFKGGK
jgi:Bacteriophage clamp loader A subunit